MFIGFINLVGSFIDIDTYNKLDKNSFIVFSSSTALFSGLLLIGSEKCSKIVLKGLKYIFSRRNEEEGDVALQALIDDDSPLVDDIISFQASAPPPTPTRPQARAPAQDLVQAQIEA